MKTRDTYRNQSPNETRNSAKATELNGYIDITPYQQKGDPCYGGDTGETEYENYMQGEVIASESRKAQVHTKSGKMR